MGGGGSGGGWMHPVVAGRPDMEEVAGDEGTPDTDEVEVKCDWPLKREERKWGAAHSQLRVNGYVDLHMCDVCTVQVRAATNSNRAKDTNRLVNSNSCCVNFCVCLCNQAARAQLVCVC